MAVTLRDADVDDAESLAGLVVQLGYPVSPESIRNRILRLTESDVDRLVVAERDGTVVGLAALHLSHSIEYDEPAAKLSAARFRGDGSTLREVAAVRPNLSLYLVDYSPLRR